MLTRRGALVVNVRVVRGGVRRVGLVIEVARGRHPRGRRPRSVPDRIPGTVVDARPVNPVVLLHGGDVAVLVVAVVLDGRLNEYAAGVSDRGVLAPDVV